MLISDGKKTHIYTKHCTECATIFMFCILDKIEDAWKWINETQSNSQAFCTAEETINRTQGQPMKGENIWKWCDLSLISKERKPFKKRGKKT